MLWVLHPIFLPLFEIKSAAIYLKREDKNPVTLYLAEYQCTVNPAQRRRSKMKLLVGLLITYSLELFIQTAHCNFWDCLGDGF